MLLRIIARKKFYINAKMKMSVGDNFYITNKITFARKENLHSCCGAAICLYKHGNCMLGSAGIYVALGTNELFDVFFMENKSALIIYVPV